MPPIRTIVHRMEGVDPLGFVEVIKSGIGGIHIIVLLVVSYIYVKCAMKYVYKIVFNVVGLGFFHYAVL